MSKRRKLLEVAAVGAGAAAAFALTGCSACSGSGGPHCGGVVYPAPDASRDARATQDTGTGEDVALGDAGIPADAGQE